MSQITVSLDVTDITVALQISQAAAGAVTSVDGLTGAVDLSSTYQPKDADLTALAGLATAGLVARTGAGTVAARTITAPAAGLTVANGDGVSGAPTLALANDLAAIEALSATGIARRTASDTWSVGTLVTLAEQADIPTNRIMGRGTAGTGAQEALTVPETRTLLGLAAVATSGSATDLTTGTLPIARIADGAVTLAKLADVATATILGRTTAGTGVPEALTLTQARALLGIPEIVLSSAWTNSTTSLSDITGLTFTPEANGVYLVEVRGAWSSAASTTGFQWLIDPGNGDGGGMFASRGSSSSAQAILIGSLDGVTDTGGTNAPATPGDECGFYGFAIITATASPTAVYARGKSEIAASQVAIGANHACLTYRRLA